MSGPRHTASAARVAATVFLTSAALIGYELALIRCLAVAQWHHNAHWVISTALLGFGASGTGLTFLGRRLLRRFEGWALALTLGFSVSILACFRAAQALPLNPQYLLHSPRELGLMIAYHLLLMLPFLLGASVIGLALMQPRARIASLYGANLLGSGLGGVAMVFAMFLLPETGLILAAAGTGSLGAMPLLFGWVTAARPERTLQEAGRAVATRIGLAATLATAVAIALLAWPGPLTLRSDPHKALAHVAQLEAQGDAERIATTHSPRARLDVYRSALFHDTLFAGFTATLAPPDQLGIFADGDRIGTVFEIDDAGGAEILDHTLMSVAYRLSSAPRVLLLGEAGGTNVWLAQRWSASSITVVQGNPQIVALMTGPLADRNGGVFARSNVSIVTEASRLFVESDRGAYDLIQLVEAEGMSVGVSGLAAVREDFLLTVEGLTACLRRLRPSGLLAVARQQQDPPRDNLRILTTLVAALEAYGVKDPGAHVVQLRNYLGVVTLASPTPIEVSVGDRILDIAKDLQLDVEWLPVPDWSPGTPYARIPGPEGDDVSYYHFAASEVFSPRRDAFIDAWVYDIRPATDDRPYFFGFLRWSSLPAIRVAYGSGWLSKLELGSVAVAASLVEVAVVGGILILVPLLWLRRRGGGRTLPTCGYFLLLGLGYMLIEILMIVRFGAYLGDPVLTTGGIVSGFLVFSGLGSLFSRRLAISTSRRVLWGFAGIAVIGGASAFALGPLFSAAASLPLGLRLLVTIIWIAPLAFLMGIPFPVGLTAVADRRPALVPWAWGVNGLASVAAPSLAILLATSVGLRCLTWISVVVYALAGLVFRWHLGRRAPR